LKKAAPRKKRMTREEWDRVESIKRGIALQAAFLDTMIIGYAIGDAKTRAMIRRMFK